MLQAQNFAVPDLLKILPLALTLEPPTGMLATLTCCTPQKPEEDDFKEWTRKRVGW